MRCAQPPSHGAFRAVRGIPAILVLLTVWLCSACSPPPVPSVPDKSSGSLSCHYELWWDEPTTLDVWVEARCTGGELEGFTASEEVMAGYVRDIETVLSPQDAGEPVRRIGHVFALPQPMSAVQIRYRIDLDTVARQFQHIDVGYQQGSSWLVPISTWLLRPQPLPARSRITFAVRPPEGAHYTTPVPKVHGRHQLSGEQIRNATYTVFGKLDTRHIMLPGPMTLAPNRATSSRARLELVTLDGDFTLPSAARERWIEEAALGVARFFHGFPVSQSMVVLVPRNGRHGVLHGKVVATGGAAAVIQVGEHTGERQLYDDWILVHELFHLGFPSFRSEGKWLDEGLATYFEPIIRARAGWSQEHEVWDEFTRDMHQGLRAVEEEGLLATNDARALYWGGAIVALLADVETRQRTGGQLGLEDGLRAVLTEGGNATEVWSLDRALMTIDARLGSDTMRRLSARHAQAGERVGLWELFQELGITRTRAGVELDDDAPRAQLRRSIVKAAAIREDNALHGPNP